MARFERIMRLTVRDPQVQCNLLYDSALISSHSNVRKSKTRAAHRNRMEPELALAAIYRIVRDTHERFDPHNFGRSILSQNSARHPTEPFRCSYFGAAGVIWALDYLNAVGATAMKRDYADSLVELAAKNRADLALRAPHRYSYLMGDVGILLVQWRLARAMLWPTKFFTQSKQT